MKSCMYCEKRNLKRESLMIPVLEMEQADLYLMRDQHYKGRCVISAKKHYREFYQMTGDERALFFNEVSAVAKTLEELLHPDKINYAIYGDEVPHVHVHVVPKYKDMDDWGKAFKLDPGEQVLTEEELTKLADRFRIALTKEIGGSV